MTTLDLIRKHKAVHEISIEDGGDLIMVYLKKGWNRYGICSDGYTKGFRKEFGDTQTTALKWVRSGVYECDDSKCERCTGDNPYYR
tara:strand:- start:502 stop:759 length:258 start_codon:yes stop_codon:yes gene_type:complete